MDNSQTIPNVIESIGLKQIKWKKGSETITTNKNSRPFKTPQTERASWSICRIQDLQILKMRIDRKDDVQPAKKKCLQELANPNLKNHTSATCTQKFRNTQTLKHASASIKNNG